MKTSIVKTNRKSVLVQVIGKFSVEVLVPKNLVTQSMSAEQIAITHAIAKVKGIQ